jgi:O-antigen/teichoic acid export membrane protein
MELLRSRPGLTSIVGGVLFAALTFVLGGGRGLLGVALAAVLGVVFAISMYAAARARRSRSD